MTINFPSPLLTPRSWQIEAMVRAAKLTGSHEGELALVEARRYGALADQIEKLRTLAEGASRSIPADAITVNLVRLAGLPKDKARECEQIVRQVLARLIADAAAPLPPARCCAKTLMWDESRGDWNVCAGCPSAKYLSVAQGARDAGVPPSVILPEPMTADPDEQNFPAGWNACLEAVKEALGVPGMPNDQQEVPRG